MITPCFQEVIRRRFGRHSGNPSGNWAIMPDLMLIDGGKGQLNSVLGEMKGIGVENVPVAGIAKEREEIFLPHRSQPVLLPPTSPGLQLLQRLRDEAHRFAIGYHHPPAYAPEHGLRAGLRARHRPPGAKRSLLKRFGSVAAIREASPEELTAAEGMSESLARKIKEYL